MNHYLSILNRLYYPVSILMILIGLLVQDSEQPTKLEESRLLWIPGTYCLYSKVANNELNTIFSPTEHHECQSSRTSVSDFFEHKVDVLIKEIRISFPTFIQGDLCKRFSNCFLEKSRRDLSEGRLIFLGVVMLVIRFVYIWLELARPWWY